jgi:hypothetical protein
MRNAWVRKYLVGCWFLVLVLIFASQQVFADPSIYFYGGYVFASGNSAVQLTFQVEGVQGSDQVHVVASISKSNPAPYWVDRQDYYYRGPGIFNVFVYSKDGRFLHGATYYVTLYVIVPIGGPVPTDYVQFANYSIQA